MSISVITAAVIGVLAGFLIVGGVAYLLDRRITRVARVLSSRLDSINHVASEDHTWQRKMLGKAFAIQRDILDMVEAAAKSVKNDFSLSYSALSAVATAAATQVGELEASCAAHIKALEAKHADIDGDVDAIALQWSKIIAQLARHETRLKSLECADTCPCRNTKSPGPGGAPVATGRVPRATSNKPEAEKLH